VGVASKRWGTTAGAVVGALALAATCATAQASQVRAPSRAPAAALRPSAAGQGDLTTYEYNDERTGDDTVDPTVTALSANATWDDTLDGAVFGEPLIYQGIVYVGTEGDSIYAIDATTGHVLWRVHVGTPASLSVVDAAPTLGSGCGDIDPLGITGTPVIDTSNGELFATEETIVGAATWQDIRHWMFAVSLKTHRELWHRDVDPPHANTANHYYIPAEQQRPAMTLFDGRLFDTYGGLDGDCGQYHGYVFGLDETGKGQVYSYQVPTQREGGIWGGGGAVVSPAGDLYVATGNGSSNTLADYDEGNSLIELSTTLHRLGYWAPSNWVQLNDQDWDLGSASPIMLPGTSLLFVAGKPSAAGSIGYLMRQSPLGGIGHGAFHGPSCTGGGVFGADATDTVGSQIYVYTACQNGTEALLIHATSPISFSEAWAPSTGTPNGSPIVAGGYVWALDWNNNLLYAMDPTTGHVAFSRSTDPLNHFATPGLGDGMVVVPTQGGVEAFRTAS